MWKKLIILIIVFHFFTVAIIYISVLTTWYDVYETLLHLLLDQTNLVDTKKSNYLVDKFSNRGFQNKPKGQSLFLKLPKRNCLSANIADYLCGCKKSYDIGTHEKIIQYGALHLIDYINNILLKNFKNLCMHMKLKRVIDSQIIFEAAKKYSIIFETAPNNAIFDAQFKVNYFYKNGLPKLQILGKIIRINTYGTSSRCINNYELRNFCYCFSFHEKIQRTKAKTEIEQKRKAIDW